MRRLIPFVGMRTAKTKHTNPTPSARTSKEKMEKSKVFLISKARSRTKWQGQAGRPSYVCTWSSRSPHRYHMRVYSYLAIPYACVRAVCVLHLHRLPQIVLCRFLFGPGGVQMIMKILQITSPINTIQGTNLCTCPPVSSRVSAT